VIGYSDHMMKILFASLPADGHFTPLTGLAVHLRDKGHDVRWYTGPSYGPKLASLGVPHFPFVTATDVNGENLTEHYPEYAKLGLGPKAIAFALEKVFFVNLEAHLKDILALRASFAFEAIVFDGAFYAGRLVAEKTGVPAFPIWPAPTPAPVSKTAPPPFFGLRPKGGVLGNVRDAIVMKMLRSSMKGGMNIWRALRAKEGLAPWEENLFDVHNDTSKAMFMVGTPSMDLPREDWPKHLRFVGPLVGHKRTTAGAGAGAGAGTGAGAGGAALPQHVAKKIEAYRGRVVVVAQGTIDNRDPEKLFVPTLSALQGSDKLVIATTGGRHAADLRARFPQDNVLVEDWIDYDALMPHASVFVTNGGYGSVMQALVNGVPLVLAGKLEGKNDICARLDWRGYGVDLRTERPTSQQVAKAVTRVLAEPHFRDNVGTLRAELASYDPFAIIEREVVRAHAAAPSNGPAAIARAS
jgi:UDP:flavonoid glycosyltransferase YjiC (YdhE family)